MKFKMFRVEFPDMYVEDLIKHDGMLEYYEKSSNLVRDERYDYKYQYTTPSSYERDAWVDIYKSKNFLWMCDNYPMFHGFHTILTEDEIMGSAGTGLDLNINFKNATEHYLDDSRLVTPEVVSSMVKSYTQFLLNGGTVGK